MTLVAQNLVKHFGGVKAVDDFSLVVHPGEILGLIGPNGAGKTTSFNLLTGRIVADAGVVTLDDVEVTRAKPWKRAKQGLARTFQHTSLFPGLSFDDNMTVAFAATSRLRRAERTSRLLELTELLHLEDIARSHMVGEMSYGVQRRMSIAIALANRPKYILLDEPAAGLNSEEGHHLGEAIQAIAASGVGVVLVEHDLELVGRVCSHVSVLAAGRRIFSGDFRDALRDSQVVASYLGGSVADA